MTVSVTWLVIAADTRLPSSGEPIRPRLRIDLGGWKPAATSLSPLGTTHWMVAAWEAMLADLGLSAPGAALRYKPLLSLEPTDALVRRLGALSAHDVLRLGRDPRVLKLATGEMTLIDR